MNKPEFVRVQYAELTVPQIEQSYIEVKDREKLDVLCRVIDLSDPQLAIIFCNTKRRAEELAGKVKARGYRAEELHGDMKQSQRDRVMGGFRKGQIDILIATDVAARGIDVDDVDMVINFDVPQDVEYYVHRIGRTGRAGKSGRAITFVAPRDFTKLREIEHYAKIKIPKIPVPSQSDVAKTRTLSMLEKVRETIREGGLEAYTRIIEDETEGDLTSVEIAAALLKLQMEQGSAEPVVKKEKRSLLRTPVPKLAWSGSSLASAGSTRSSPRILSVRLPVRRVFPGKPSVQSGSLTPTHLSRSQRSTHLRSIRS